MDFLGSKENLTREQVVALLGEETVKEAESLSCEEFRVGEFHADLQLDEDWRLVVVYYQDPQVLGETEDWGGLQWIPDHYDLVWA